MIDDVRCPRRVTERGGGGGRAEASDLGKFAHLYIPKSISLYDYIMIFFFVHSTLIYWRDDNTGPPTPNIGGCAIDTPADKQKRKKKKESSLLPSGGAARKTVFTSNCLPFLHKLHSFWGFTKNCRGCCTPPENVPGYCSTPTTPGCEFAIPKPFSYGACISLWRSIEKKGQKILLALRGLRGLELTDFGFTAQCFYQ